MRRLADPEYLAFPFRINTRPATSRRRAHVREQIEQVLFTNPPERLFRPEFGAGLQQLVFAPNTSVVWDLTRNRLSAALAEALLGEVDPSTLEIEVQGSGEYVRVIVRYVLAVIGEAETHELTVGVEDHG